jgi:7-cyano-7-deazaguanine synthase
MKSKTLAVLLLSGGLDSTTLLAVAVRKYGFQNVVAISVSYGQKHSMELEQAKKIAKYYQVEHKIIDLSSILQFSNCALLKDSTQEIKDKSYAEQIKEEGKVNTYVPFRNGLMLSSVAAIAYSLIEDTEYEEAVVLIANHADDSAGDAYADCSFDFINAMNSAINIGTYKKVFVEAPFTKFNKADIVFTGLMMNVPYEMTRSCYKDTVESCGECGTCIDRLKAFEANGAIDPIIYKK